MLYREHLEETEVLGKHLRFLELLLPHLMQAAVAVVFLLLAGQWDQVVLAAAVAVGLKALQELLDQRTLVAAVAAVALVEVAAATAAPALSS